MPVRHFRKKPVEIEAVFFDGSEESFKECCEFAKDIKLELHDECVIFGVTYGLINEMHASFCCPAGNWLAYNKEIGYFQLEPELLALDYEIVTAEDRPLVVSGVLCKLGQMDKKSNKIIDEELLVAIEKEYREKDLKIKRVASELHISIEIPIQVEPVGYIKIIRCLLEGRFDPIFWLK